MSGYLENLFNNNDDDRDLSAIVAGIGFNDGANKGFWRIQPRDLHGRWIEMGAEIRAAFKHLGKVISINGHAVGSTGSPDEIRMMIRGMSHFGIPDGIYPVSSKHAELIGAVLPDEYLISKGIDPNSVDTHGNTVTDMMKAGDLPEISKLERADITPQDVDLVNGGAEGTPEGKENAAFKSTDEGKKIAELPGAGAGEVMSPDEVWNALRDIPYGDPEKDRLRKLTNTDPKDVGKLSDKELKDILNEFAFYARNNPQRNPGDPIDPEDVQWFTPLEDAVALELKRRKGDIAPSPDAEGAPDVAAKAADKAVQDAFEGDNAPDLDSLIDDASGDLLDESALDGIDDLLGPDVDTSDFDLPIVEQARVDQASIEVDDFIRHPDNGDLLKVTDATPLDNGGSNFTGIDRDGVEQKFTAREGDEIRRVIHGEPGDTSLQDYLATPTVAPVKPVTPKPADILPKPVTVPDNAITAEDFAVGDKVWDAQGHEIGTVRKVLEKGFDNFGRDYTKAEVVGSDGKVSTTRLGHERGLKKVPAPEKPIAPEKPVAPVEPAAIPEPVQVELPNTPAVTPAVAPETPEDLTPATKKAEDLVPGDTIHNANGTSGQVTSVSNENGKVTVNYTDQNGEAKSKRFLEGNDVNTKPTSELAPDREANGNPISEEQKQQLEDLDAMDSADPIEDADLRDRLMSAYNEMQDGDFQDEGEVQDLIDEVNDYFVAKNPVREAKPLPAVHDRDMGPAVRSEAEMQSTKGSGNKAKGTKKNADRVQSQLEEDYPDGHYIDNPNDDFPGGFITHRQTIDGGKTRHEIIVKRTTGNQFLVINRFTDLATGEVKDFISHDYRDTYSAIHGKTNGIEKMAQFFAGTLRPANGGGAKVNPGDKFTGDKAYFNHGGDWKRKMTYWREKYSKMGRTLNDINKMKNEKLKATFLDELKNKYNGDLNEMNAAHTLQDMRMLTLEEKLAMALDGESERQNTTTDIVVGNIERSRVQGMLDAMKSSNRTDARDRFQELMNLLPEDSPRAKKRLTTFLRQMLKEDLDKTGITGAQRTKALQKLSAVVTNYVLNADKKWAVENELRFPHVSGSGVVVAKRGDKAEWTTNTGEKVVGVIVDLRSASGPRGNDDFVRMQFLDPKTGKLRTENSDLAATRMRIVDPSTPVSEYTGWDRNVPLAFKRGGQEFADRRAKALAQKTEQRRIRLLGSDGEPQDDSSETVEVVPNGVTKQATQLLAGDTIYDTKGNAIGSVVKTKMTSKNGQPIVAVMYKDVDGNVQKIAYHPDQEIGPDAPKA